MHDISVVLPAYNEKENITAAVAAANSYLKKRFKHYEIIVVSDGGTDGTLEIVKNLQSQNKNLVLVNHGKNLGYGAALRSGFATARGKLVFYTDSDNQYDINELDCLLPYLQKHDIVAGYRI